MSKFNLPYESKQKAEKNSGERLVETAGYIPAQKRIENLINAGQRLKDYRSEQFDFPDEETARKNSGYVDRTRQKNYDMAEAFQDGLLVKNRLKQQKAAAEQKAFEAASEASKSVSDASNIPSEG